MLYFNVLRPLFEEGKNYFYFNDENGTIYEGYDLPEKLDDLMVLEIVADFKDNEPETACFVIEVRKFFFKYKED